MGIDTTRRLAGFRFRRQEPISPSIVDFDCASADLVLELNGDSHATSEEYNRVRQAFLESRGFKRLRFWNTERFEDQDCVLEAIYQACLTRIQNRPELVRKLDEWGQLNPSLPPSLPDGKRGKNV